MSKKGVHLFIEGWVQGVFFRYYTREKAKELGVTGWVRNLPDGKVEVVAEGEEEAVDSLVKWCYQGPPSARVYDVECIPQEYTGKFKDFSIKH